MVVVNSIYSPSVCVCVCEGVLRQVVAKCEVGAAVVDLCEMGDKLILEETSKVYKKEKEMKKGKCTSLEGGKGRRQALRRMAEI